MVRWTFQELGDVDSTMIVARNLAAKGAPEGTTVMARSQTSGEGRLGRTWVSPVGGLYMSFILRPTRLPKPETVTLVSAVAVAEGLGGETGLEPSIRWPNDVMVNGRKIAGVIAEAQTTRQEINQIIVGVGVNCNTNVKEEVAEEATSTLDETGTTVEVSRLGRSILDSFRLLYDRWQMGEDLLPVWKSWVKTIGRDVLVKLKADEAPLPFKASGLDGEGGLILESTAGTRVVRAEDIEWLREQA